MQHSIVGLQSMALLRYTLRHMYKCLKVYEIDYIQEAYCLRVSEVLTAKPVHTVYTVEVYLLFEVTLSPFQREKISSICVIIPY